MFQAVTTARRLLDDLTSKPSEIPYAEAHKRLQGVLIGPDDKQTCIVVMLSDAAIKNFRSVLGRSVADGKLPWKRKPGILWEALEQCGIPIGLGSPRRPAGRERRHRRRGRPHDRPPRRDLGRAGHYLGVVVAPQHSAHGDCVRAAACSARRPACTAVYWSGHTMDAVLMSMPSMLYVLAISGAIHLINYYRRGDQGLMDSWSAPDEAITPRLEAGSTVLGHDRHRPRLALRERHRADRQVRRVLCDRRVL